MGEEQNSTHLLLRATPSNAWSGGLLLGNYFGPRQDSNSGVASRSV
jgi:hypothetical protein